jgi:probable HAF family extracellular repeat protein
MRIIALLLVSTAILTADPVYFVTNLGGLGGSSSIAYRINGSGASVGWAETPGGVNRGFLASNGSWQDVSQPSSSDSYAYGINSTGTIAGTSYQNGEAHGWIHNASGFTDLGAGLFATGINDANVVIGSNGHAFTWINGHYQDLGTLPGGDWSAAYGISNTGVVAGNANLASGLFRAFIWTADAGMISLGALGGANSYATDVNDRGEVIGHSAVSSGYDHAFVAHGGALTDLGTLAGGSSFAYGINESGAIVGYSWSDSAGNPHAFIYRDGMLLDLNALIPAGAGWELLEAYGINDAGEIAGSGLLNGVASAFLLKPESPPLSATESPVPEPRTAIPVAIALGVLIVIRQRLRASASR